jgi:hypothetical protein
LLRDLAREVAEAAASPVQAERIGLWRDLNRLAPRRPMVLLDPQNGWDDLVPEAGLRCADPVAHDAERRLRRLLYRHRAIPDDHPVTADWPVAPVIHSTGWGVTDTTERTAARGLRWDPPLKIPADAARLRPAALSVDRVESAVRLSFFQDLFDGILDVRAAGVSFVRCGLTRKLIVLRGLEPFLLDLHEEPSFVHELMSFLRDEQLAELDFLEREGLLGLNNGPMDLAGSGGIAATDALPAPGFTPGRPRRADLFAWGESQEASGVGPDHFPRLRWVSISPWADRARAAELLGNRFVYCWKPQPSLVCRERPDWDGAEREIRETLAFARGCNLSIVLKDTTSFFGEPSRATRWASIARRLAEEAAGR